MEKKLIAEEGISKLRIVLIYSFGMLYFLPYLYLGFVSNSENNFSLIEFIVNFFISLSFLGVPAFGIGLIANRFNSSKTENVFGLILFGICLGSLSINFERIGPSNWVIYLLVVGCIYHYFESLEEYDIQQLYLTDIGFIWKQGSAYNLISDNVTYESKIYFNELKKVTFVGGRIIVNYEDSINQKRSINVKLSDEFKFEFQENIEENMNLLVKFSQMNINQ